MMEMERLIVAVGEVSVTLCGLGLVKSKFEVKESMDLDQFFTKV